MNRILVTGAHGQLGSEIRKLEALYPLEFTFTDIDELDLCKGDDLQAFLKENPADYIINCAAYVQVDLAEKEQEAAMKVNRDAVGNLAEALELFPDTRLLHVSTDYVFSGSSVLPLKEDDPTAPQGAYGRSKLAGEVLVKDHPRAMVIRTSWLYSSFGSNFVLGMTKRLKAGQDLGIVFDQVGTPTYAGDLARAILDVISKVASGSCPFVPGIYHYSNEGLCSWYDLTVEMARLLESGSKIRPIESHEYPLPAKRPAYSVLNKRKIRDTYGVDIPHWRESLEKCMKEIEIKLS